jgi:hypothetical protein
MVITDMEKKTKRKEVEKYTTIFLTRAFRETFTNKVPFEKRLEEYKQKTNIKGVAILGNEDSK